MGLKNLATGLNLKNVPQKVIPDDELEFDREYVPGHDSLSEAEEEETEIIPKQVSRKQKLTKMKEKKQKKATNPVSRPITRSRATAPLSMQVHDVNLICDNNYL